MAPYIQTPPLSKTHIFHVGYPKTATTWLQKNIFPKFADDFDRMGLALWSQESQSGWFFNDDLQKPYELAKTYPQAKAIIVLRGQQSMLPSFYYTYLKAGYTLRYNDYVNTLASNRKFFYYDFVRAYQDAMGPESVLVLLYENLRKDPLAFLLSIFNFMGINFDPEKIVFSTSRINSSAGVFELIVTRWLNFATSPKNELRSTLRKKILPIAIAADFLINKSFPHLKSRFFTQSSPFIENIYSKNNTLLSKLLAISLPSTYPSTPDS